ncbi:YpiB family protein [Staphylococcus carnosus]|uniref:UPF0302 domain-containing protein n=1 Tax=Staphylococcus carnosus (strain TM300) TaxID=396513 RepID=B9DNU8_STACT|nr:YpiB family protein [Staphylococcus carnosus]KOR13634.1 hypothetical protein AMC75_01805 [Staphylococcus carnosus]QPT04137.1 YpiB family protein [Staphylococcus carnosus]UQA66862.1 YpiB family protein [Staphylococcus carnosus]UTB78303.1 hypothetical protein A2I62_06970 [Staphylococcus carnosus]UTB87851.1 hypothetical protein A2I63_06960 [Staphylococcus carnosus]
MIDKESLNLMKKNFIEYLLFQYKFKSRISVWLLNLIKSDVERLDDIYFVDQSIPNHNTLEISVADTEKTAIQYYDNQIDYRNTNEIFRHIAYERPKFDIKINLTKRDVRLDEILLSQLLLSPDYSLHLHDLYAVTMTPQAELSLINRLQNTIDISLQIHDSEYFYRLSHLLNTLKARSINFPTKD